MGALHRARAVVGDSRTAAGMSAAAHNDSTRRQSEPLALLIAALGGQGGGVLTDWIVLAARAAGFAVQATSTPGVSQRTGATTYYVEMAPARDAEPVFALTPLAGRVDVLVCAELVEAARMLERGMCTPVRTTVVASTHRVYTTVEKMRVGDGRIDSARIVAAVQALARQAILFDMERIRARHGVAISAVLFGAVAGSGALPLSRAACETAIRSAGKGVAANLVAFGEAYAHAAGRGTDGVASQSAGLTRDAATAPLPLALARRVATLPLRVAEVAGVGAARAIDYQGVGYAAHYLDRVERIAKTEASAVARGANAAGEVARETARHLALWMCYEDMIRVAAQKARTSRHARIRREVAAGAGDVVRIYDQFKPGMQEVAAIVPRRLGAWLEHRSLPAGAQSSRGRSVELQTSAVTGAFALRLVAALRPLRPFSLRFAREQAAIDAWLADVASALVGDKSPNMEVAREIARLPRLQKGYGNTLAMSCARLQRILEAYRRGGGAGSDEAAKVLRAAVALALDDPDGERCERTTAAPEDFAPP